MYEVPCYFQGIRVGIGVQVVGWGSSPTPTRSNITTYSPYGFLSGSGRRVGRQGPCFHVRAPEVLLLSSVPVGLLRYRASAGQFGVARR